MSSTPFFAPPTILSDVFGNYASNSPAGELTIVEPFRLAGAAYGGTTIDPVQWTFLTTGSGTVTQANGTQVVATGTTANSVSAVVSTAKARFVGENLNRWSGVLQLSDSGVVNNVRRWGATSATDGIYFALNGTTLGVATLSNSVETFVPFSQWNQGIAAPVLTNCNIYRIVYGVVKIWFYINNQPAHSMSFPNAPYATTYTFPTWLSSINSNGQTVNASVIARSNIIQRLGHYETQPFYGRITTAATQTLKTGAGNLDIVTINTPPAATAATITIYDNTTATGTPIAVITTLATSNPVTLTYGLTFYTGLTVVSTGTQDATVIFE